MSRVFTLGDYSEFGFSTTTSTGSEVRRHRLRSRSFAVVRWLSLVAVWSVGLGGVDLVCPGLQRTVVAADEDIAPAVEKAVQRGVEFLKKEIGKTSEGYNTLAAYALLKGGVPATDDRISGAINMVLNSVKDGKYTLNASRHRHYEAGVNLMLLVDATGSEHLPEVQAITNYIVEDQFENGSWNYRFPHIGDTSVTQYIILGLWAAHRAGAIIPPEVLDKAARWHMSVQEGSGGFAYTPGKNIEYGMGRPTPNMTAAGTGSMLIIRRLLFPNEPEWTEVYGSEKREARDSNKKFGVLQEVDLSSDVVVDATGKTIVKTDFTPTFTTSTLDGYIKKGMGRVDTDFRPSVPPKFYLYYYYTLERVTALSGTVNLQNKDWFTAIAQEVLKIQKEDGGWDSELGHAISAGRASGTSFAILFLTQSTAKTLGNPTVVNLGAGLLAGGRGLPDSLDDVHVKDGKVGEEKLKDPLSKLLGDLENPNSVLDDSVQAAVIEKVQVGDREELIGQRDRLVRLVDHPSPEIRRMAFWALGRSDRLSDAGLMIRALKNEIDLGVLIEARNALCFISHKPNGLLQPNDSSDPFGGLKEDATDDQKKAAVEQWKNKEYRRWLAWYLQIRPYDEKDDFSEALLKP